ncbi:hypothetical protein M271_34520 [Streptomyces rapamycinicus NRRL 5491]|nr:hypothetical protein M271_34520 [Streptomyces rapamycinicus NRRL 5491]
MHEARRAYLGPRGGAHAVDGGAGDVEDEDGPCGPEQARQDVEQQRVVQRCEQEVLDLGPGGQVVRQRPAGEAHQAPGDADCKDHEKECGQQGTGHGAEPAQPLVVSIMDHMGVS